MLKLFIFFTFIILVNANPTVKRPCTFDNTDCIRNVLAQNSLCKIPKSPTLSPDYKIKTFRFDTPAFNSSYMDVDLHIRNEDKCYVSEFFYNYHSNTAVLTIDCPNLEFESERYLFQHRSMLEDAKYSYHFKGTYPLIRLTTTLLHANKMNLCTSYTFADVAALPLFDVKPNDNATDNFLERDLSLLFVFERETFFYRAPQLARHYVNNYLCDFGCK